LTKICGHCSIAQGQTFWNLFQCTGTKIKFLDPVPVHPYYYNLLQVPTSADDSLIARQYYAMTRRYNPQRPGQSDEVAHILQEIGTAYVVLTHPDFRQRYNQYGKDFMNYDDDSEEGDYKEAPEQKVPLVDPMVLYSVLFGSDFSQRQGRKLFCRCADDKFSTLFHAKSWKGTISQLSFLSLLSLHEYVFVRSNVNIHDQSVHSTFNID
jgi:DnaJ domain